MGHDPEVLVTFDLFSALIDSRTGGSRCFGQLASRRCWAITGQALYDEWDRRNKASQRDTTEWISFAEHSRRTLRATYLHLGLEGDAAADAMTLLAGIPQWPLWPDVAASLPTLATRFRVGILSNVDDDLFRLTRVSMLVHDSAVLTSQRLRAYKPAPAIYHRAVERADGHPFVHVAASARDVRGAVEAAVPVIRIVRPGHVIDPSGPRPKVEVTSLDEIADKVRELVEPTH